MTRKEAKEKYFHWMYGENRVVSDDYGYLINLEHLVSIRFDVRLVFDTTFEDFKPN